MQQVITFTFFRFTAWKNQLWAFSRMQLAHKHFQNVQGLSFYKLMGSGGGDGFQWQPDWSAYCLMGVWDTIHCAKEFFQKAIILKQYKQKSLEQFTLWLKPLEAHGSWSGKQPFQFQNYQNGTPIAVLTRATIYWKHVIEFWRNVPSTSASMHNFEGKLFSKGIGELPIVQQATISVWEDFESMKRYAYKNPIHQKVIRLTRQKNWYREEMFARFQVIYAQGSWKGSNPLGKFK
ncbi:MAG: DUF3291 domain-containing protein [Bacteroidota bacterium]